MDASYNRYKQGVGVTYTSPIFGPIRSRRLGISLGINLLPGDGKWCSFDCIYCECGLNRDKRAKQPLPHRQEVRDALENKLQEMLREGQIPDVLTFAGNGEPTLNPEFPDIIDDVICLRNKYCPQAKVTVLSNSTMIHNEKVRNALLKTDNPIMKLDTVNSEYISAVDQPSGNYNVESVIEDMIRFDGNIIIQTMFMNGKGVSNTSPLYLNPYIDALKRIRPRQVMIYTIDRETPVVGLEKATPEQLDLIAEQIKFETGIPVSVSY